MNKRLRKKAFLLLVARESSTLLIWQKLSSDIIHDKPKLPLMTWKLTWIAKVVAVFEVGWHFHQHVSSGVCHDRVMGRWFWRLMVATEPEASHASWDLWMAQNFMVFILCYLIASYCWTWERTFKSSFLTWIWLCPSNIQLLLTEQWWPSLKT